MKNLLIVFTAILFIVSCNNEPQEIGVYKSGSLGKQGEITIVMHQQLWTSKMGDLTRKYLSPDIEYFPQTEKLFDLKHETEGDFNSGSKRQKNIIQ